MALQALEHLIDFSRRHRFAHRHAEHKRKVAAGQHGGSAVVDQAERDIAQGASDEVRAHAGPVDFKIEQRENRPQKLLHFPQINPLYRLEKHVIARVQQRGKVLAHIDLNTGGVGLIVPRSFNVCIHRRIR